MNNANVDLGELLTARRVGGYYIIKPVISNRQCCLLTKYLKLGEIRGAFSIYLSGFADGGKG